jgi:hypothetical protein
MWAVGSLIFKPPRFSHLTRSGTYMELSLMILTFRRLGSRSVSVLEIKREVNELLNRLGETPRYPSASENGEGG